MAVALIKSYICGIYFIIKFFTYKFDENSLAIRHILTAERQPLYLCQCANIQSTGNLLCLFEFDCPVKSLTPQRVSNRTSQVPQETLKPQTNQYIVEKKNLIRSHLAQFRQRQLSDPCEDVRILLNPLRTPQPDRWCLVQGKHYAVTKLTVFLFAYTALFRW